MNCLFFFFDLLGPPGMNPMNTRGMNPPRGQLGPMNPNYAGMRPPPPNANMGPGGPGPGLPPMGPMGPGGPPPGPGGPPPGGPGRPWQPNPSMNFSSASPGAHYPGPPGPPGAGPPPGPPGNGPPGPGTPIMPSPQGSTGPYSPANHRMGTPNTGRDSNSAGDGMYTMMKPGANMPNVSHLYLVSLFLMVSSLLSLFIFSSNLTVRRDAWWS